MRVCQINILAYCVKLSLTFDANENEQFFFRNNFHLKNRNFFYWISVSKEKRRFRLKYFFLIKTIKFLNTFSKSCTHLLYLLID